MKSVLCVFVCLLAIPCLGGPIIQTLEIDILEGQGFGADYNHNTRTLEWDAGASISLYTSTNGTGDAVATVTTGVDIEATFTIVDDMSANGVAKAEFSSIDWSIKYMGVPILWGTQAAGKVFLEEEQADFVGFPPPGSWIDTGILWGTGVVEVSGDLLSELGLYEWSEGSGSEARLKSKAIVSPGFDDYDDQSYNTFNTTMWVYADETVIPEPATMLILGLGSFMALRRRK